MTDKGTRRALLLAGLGALSAAAITHAPAAKADQYDFINALDEKGVTYNNLSSMVEVGKDVCHYLRGGTSPSWLMSTGLAPGGWSPVERAIIIGEAVHTMCPDQVPMVNAWAQGQQQSAHGSVV